ncbi:MAG: MBL fold metallo-hydrolase [Proteobacteria bacterium]|nr:MBL fold metallo-hydrolase [Pseudomonadota bacterium]
MMQVRPLGGGVEVAEIIEFHAPTHDAGWMLPDADPGLLVSHRQILENRFWTPHTNRLVFTYKVWLLKTPDAVILIDTGCGNHKPRLSPYQSHINTPMLDWMRALGAPPEKVTHVLHTHLHSDHVGWNTQLLDGRWTPTFPNATYYMPKADYDLFKAHRAQSMGPEMYDCVMTDSVDPVVDGGLARFIDHGDEVAGLRAIATPGHTPGHLAYEFCHRGDVFLFSGDVMHSPIQVLSPSVNSRWCEHASLARDSRAKLLRRAVECDAVVFPAHAKGVHGWRIARCGDEFTIGFDCHHGTPTDEMESA